MQVTGSSPKSYQVKHSDPQNTLPSKDGKKLGGVGASSLPPKGLAHTCALSLAGDGNGFSLQFSFQQGGWGALLADRLVR